MRAGFREREMSKTSPEQQDPRELAGLDSLYRTFETLDALEDTRDDLTVGQLCSIARAKRELRTAIREDRKAQREEARSMSAAEQVPVLLEAVSLLPVEQQVEFWRQIRHVLDKRVIAEPAETPAH
jgi:hypothetical protein